MFEQLPFLADGSAAYHAGRAFGAGTFILAILFGVFKCFRIMKREKTSTLCVLSLVIVLFALILFNLFGNLMRANGESSAAINILAGLCGVLAFLAMVGAGVLSIVGLCLYKGKEGIHNQGKSQAIWALVLSSLLILGVIVSAIVAAVQSSSEVASPPKSKEFLDGEAVFENENLNLRFQKPGKPWLEMNPEVINPDATLMFRTKRNEMLIVIAERIGVGLGFTREALVDVAKQNLGMVDGEFTFGDIEEREVNGITYAVFPTKAANFNGSGRVVNYEHWVSCQQGYCYQIIFNSRIAKPDALSKIAEKVVEGVEFIDPDEVASTAGSKIEPTRRDDLGFSIDLSNKGWSQWGSIEEDFPEAQFGALMGDSIATGIVSTELVDPSIPIDTLANGFLAAVFGKLHPDNTTDREEIRQGEVNGISLQAREKTAEGDFSFRFRVFKNDTRAWLVTAWTWDHQPERDQMLEDALESYVLFSPPEDAEKVETLDRVRKGQADIWNQVGIDHYRKQEYEAGKKYFQRAFELDPEYDQYFENWVDAMLNTDQFEEGLSLLDQHGEKYPGNLDLVIYRSRLLASQGDAEVAIESYKTAFDKGHQDEDSLLEYINVLVDLEEREKAIEELKAYRKRHEFASKDIERWQADLLIQLEKYDEGIGMIRKLSDDSPSSLSLLGDLIRAELDAEKYSEALVDADRAIADGVDNSQIHFLRGRAKLGLKSLKEAKTAFEKAQSLAPNDNSIESYLEHTAAMLGKGNISSINKELEPLPLPSVVAETAARFESDHGASLDDEFGTAVLKRIKGIFHEKGKPRKETSYTKVRITNNRGLDDYSTLQFGFDPLSESIFVNEVTVTNAAGEEIAKGNIDDYYIVDENDDLLATTEKVVHIPVPGLAIGHAVSYTVTRQDHADSKEFSYVEQPMSMMSPCAGSILFVTGETENVEPIVNDGVESPDSKEALVFTCENPARRRNEASQPWPSKNSPWVWLGDREATWQKEAEDYLSKIGTFLEEENKEIETILPEIIGDAKNEQEVIHAVTEFVQNTLNYQGIEFGTRGTIPNKISDTLKNKYGDCKDHSLLVVKLLQAADIPAHLTLVSSSAPVVDSLPSLDQFDHVIAYVPSLAGSKFADTTSDFFPCGLLAPQTLLREKALILDPGNIRLEEILPAKGQTNRIVSDRTVTFDADGGNWIEVEEKMTFEGYPATWFRSYFKNNRPSDYKERLGAMLTSHGSPIFVELSLGNLDDVRKPLEMTTTYELPRHLKIENDEISVKIPTTWEHYFTRVHQSGKRYNDVEILTDLKMESTCTVKIPPRYQVTPASLQAHRFDTSGHIVQWKAETTKSADSTIRIQASFERRNGDYPAAEYRNYTEQSNEGLDLLQSALVFRRDAE